MNAYRKNHYVPVWYQERFFPENTSDRKFYYLDLKPQAVLSKGGHRYIRNNVLHWGPPSCFYERDLYTTKFAKAESTEIEQKFFGRVDASARFSLDYFTNFKHPDVDSEAFHALLPYISIQKLRTPKGLSYLAALVKQTDKNIVLFTLQRLQQIFCATWTDCIWSIADASQSQTKFLLSDHPVTVYNKACFPNSRFCEDFNDPDIRLSGTHTLFPLSLDKILILTNLSWVRYPYGNPLKFRPNPKLFRQTLFNFQDIQTGRMLSDLEVNEINFVIKRRAYRYIAAVNKEWLYPESKVTTQLWNKLGRGYLFMPDPRSVTFSSEVILGYKDGPADAFDAYGRKPWQRGYDDKRQREREWETFHAFQGEFARVTA